MSPCSKLVVDGILGIVPEFECRLRRLQPCNIIRLDFQMRRQVFKQTDLFTNIQVFNRFADLANSAHLPFFNSNGRDFPPIRLHSWLFFRNKNPAERFRLSVDLTRRLVRHSDYELGKPALFRKGSQCFLQILDRSTFFSLRYRCGLNCACA